MLIQSLRERLHRDAHLAVHDIHATVHETHATVHKIQTTVHETHTAVHETRDTVHKTHLAMHQILKDLQELGKLTFELWSTCKFYHVRCRRCCGAQ